MYQFFSALSSNKSTHPESNCIDFFAFTQLKSQTEKQKAMEGSPLQGKCLRWQHIRNDCMTVSDFNLIILKSSVFVFSFRIFLFVVSLFGILIYQILQLVMKMAQI